jgi:hypothetical protein
MYNTLHCITRLNSFSKAHRREIQRIGEKRNKTKGQRAAEIFGKSKNQEKREKTPVLEYFIPGSTF